MLPLPVHQPLALLAGVAAGVVVDDAVLGDHQGQLPVDDGLHGDGLGQVPDLGELQLEGGGGPLHPQLFQLLEGLAVVHPDAEVAADLETQLPGPAHPVQGARQGLLHSQLLDGLQLLLQLGQLPVPADAGELDGHGHPRLLTASHRVGAGRPLVAGEVDPLRLQGQQLRGDLLAAAHRRREGGGRLGVLIPHSGVVLPGFPLRRAGALLGELLQYLPPQGVQGGQGEGKALVHPGGGLLAVERGAAGAAQLPLHLLPGEGDVHRRLGHRALHLDHPALGILRRHLGGLPRLNPGVQPHGGLAVLPALIGGAGLGKELSGVLPLLAGAEHVGPLLVQEVALGEALAGEGGLQLPQLLRRGLPALPEGVGVHPGDDGHVLGALHAALQLQAGHPHVLQLLQVAHQGHVLQGEGVLVRPLAPAVFQPAGLGAQPPVAAAAPDQGGQVALARVAHAQRPVAEHLDLNGGILADVRDLVPAQLPGQDRPGHPQVGALLHPVQGVDGHLGGGVEVDVRGHLPQHPGHPQILDDDRVHPHLTDLSGHLCRLGELPVGEQGVQGEMYFGIPEMAVRNRRRSLLPGEVLRVAAGVKIAVAQIDGAGAVLDRGLDRLHGAGGSEQLQHGASLPFLKFHRAEREIPLRLARLSFVILELEDLTLGLGQLHFQLGVLVQALLDLAAQILTGLLLLEKLVGDVHGGQHRGVGPAQAGPVHHVPHLTVHQGGTALHIVLALLGHHGVLLTRDGNGDLVLHPKSPPTSLVFVRFSGHPAGISRRDIVIWTL